MRRKERKNFAKYTGVVRCSKQQQKKILKNSLSKRESKEAGRIPRLGSSYCNLFLSRGLSLFSSFFFFRVYFRRTDKLFCFFPYYYYVYKILSRPLSFTLSLSLSLFLSLFFSLSLFFMLSVKLIYLCDRERVPRLLQVALLTFEPSLVARLQLHDVQRAVRNRRGDQLVTSPFVAIRSSRQDFKHIERLALVSSGENVQDSRGGYLVGGEAAFGSGLAGVRLDAQQVAKVSQHSFRLTVRFDGVTLRLGGNHRDVGHLVKVILEIRVRVRERSLLGRIVLGREQKRVPVAGVRDEARRVGNAAKNVGRITVRGKRRLRGGQCGRALCSKRRIPRNTFGQICVR